MYEYVYRTSAGSFMVYAKIVADVKKANKNKLESYMKISDGLWFTCTSEPIIKGELFHPGDVKELIKGLKLVDSKIIENSTYKSETLIELYSLQFDLCYFQQDALPVAMMGWAASTFRFEMPLVEVRFDRATRKFDFDY